MNIMSKILGKEKDKATQALEGELKSRIADLHLTLKNPHVSDSEKVKIRKMLDKLETSAQKELDRCSCKNGYRK